MLQETNIKKIAKAFKRYTNYPDEMIEKVIIFTSGLEAQEKINKEEQQEKPINKK